MAMLNFLIDIKKNILFSFTINSNNNWYKRLMPNYIRDKNSSNELEISHVFLKKR